MRQISAAGSRQAVNGTTEPVFATGANGVPAAVHLDDRLTGISLGLEPTSSGHRQLVMMHSWM